MSNTSDGPGKGGAKPASAVPGSTVPGSDSGPKKPSAIIDLKANEVDIKDPKPPAGAAPGSGAGKPEATATAAAAPASGSSAPAGAKPGTGAPWSGSTVAGATTSNVQGVGAPGAASGTTGPKPPDTKATDSKSSDAKAPPAGTASPAGKISGPGAGAKAAPTPAASPAPVRATSSSGGLRSAATHLAAGLAGGLLALIGAESVAPQLGLTGPARPATEDITRRLAALEAGAGRIVAASPEVDRKLAASEARIAQLERAGRSVAELSQQQTQLLAETKTLADKIGQLGGDTNAEARLVRLETTLGALATAGASDPQSGRIAQLTAVNSRLTDLQTSVANQIAALRRGVTAEVESRLTQSNEASEAARTGTQRIDRDLASVKTEAAQLTQRVEGVKSTADRLDIGLKGMREDTARLKDEIGALRDDVGRELKQVARPQDVSGALSPVASRLVALEQSVQGVVRSEDDRRGQAERIVLALELGNLKRAVERGAAYAAELAEVRRIAGPKLDLSALERRKDSGVPTIAELEREFRGLAHSMIEAESAPTDGTWTERLLASAKSVVRIRKVDQGADDAGLEAVLSRMETSLKSGKLAEVTDAAAKLPAKVKAPALGWLDKVEARATVERAIASVEGDLKASLGAASRTGNKD